MTGRRTQTFHSVNDLVSIIIPTYNRSWGLALAIKSVLAQTHQNYELLIIDDCSQDDTASVVKTFFDSRITYYRQPVNVGMVKNWGEMLRFVRSKFIVFLSDDDQLQPDFIANRLKYLSRDENIIVAFSKYDIRDRDGTLIAIHNENLNADATYGSRDLLHAALSRQWFIGASMYRKSALLKVWDLIAEDDLVLDLGLNVRLSLGEFGRGVYSATNDFIMTSHSGQNSNTRRMIVYEQASNTLERILATQITGQYAAMIKKELAYWHIVWGRYLAAQGKIDEARPHFLKAARTCPSLLAAWKQLSGALIWPRRVVASSRRQYASRLLDDIL